MNNETIGNLRGEIIHSGSAAGIPSRRLSWFQAVLGRTKRISTYSAPHLWVAVA